MAKDKKPSIFADRGTIGSSDELDEYGVWVKSEPQDLSQVSSEADGFSTEMTNDDNIDTVIPDLEDLPAFDTLGAISPDSDISPSIPEGDYDLPDFKLDNDATEEDNDSDSDIFNFGELTEPAELNSMGLDSGNLNYAEPDSAPLPAEPEGIEPNAGGSFPELDPENDEEFKEISMDDFIETKDSAGSSETEGIVSDALGSQPVHSAEKETAKEGQTLDLSTQLLMKIAEELSSIRSELSSLKKEFSGLKPAAPQTEENEKSFLGEEDDEKISLTGDELNNILNTADFTEETGSDAAMEISDNAVTGDNSDELSLSAADLDMEIDISDSNLENIAGETEPGNLSLDIEEESQIPPDLEMPDNSVLDLSSGETDELDEIRENGVEPMTSAPLPEDANYLTEDPLAENIDSEEPPPELPEASSDEGLDLSEAVIDEPDLSSEIQDNPLEEPSLEDISISLDLSDLDSVDLDTTSLDSIELESTEGDAVLPLPKDDLQSEENIPQIAEGFAAEEDDYSDVLGNEESLEAIEKIAEEPIEEAPEETEETIDKTQEESSVEAVEKIEDFSFESDDVAVAAPEEAIAEEPSSQQEISEIPANLKAELKTVLSYMDQLLEALPDDKIEEFAKSDYYDTYKKLFKELGLA